ncbi:hypothetical protein CANCADRAFT_85804 [Tortispora caseinolytica NRRL Y-17796]|uniref:CCT-theta n=1 Tax=Tortispora caseinolytica NRRL Y-17796 TaxID=767744 RepID=A0A1E4TKT0_9ASCO|nr:hypothetical protein CANCADRAFT_85804 [Tortispora caseinolytica NRRL Y-17796]
MSLSLPSAPGAQLFKSGYQTQSAEDGAVQRNILACNEVSEIVRTSLGPTGRSKLVVNRIGKVFLSSDAATIVGELEVVHPAAKLLVMASLQQEAEFGDATNLVIVFAGELLSQALKLINLGIHPAEIAKGYEVACSKVSALLESPAFTSYTLENIYDHKQLVKAISSSIASKQYGSEELISDLVAQACLQVMPPERPKAFNVDNIRVVKVMGASLEQSYVVRGMVFPREPEGQIKKLASPVQGGVHKVAVYTCAIDAGHTETKGTVLLKNAEEMLNFSKGEEVQVEALIKSIADTGIRVIVAGSTVSELALHFLDRAGILCIKVPSKFDIRRLCRVVNATPLGHFATPEPQEAGSIDAVTTMEIGGDRVTVFEQSAEHRARTTTILLRGATKNALDDIERAIDDAVNVVKCLTIDPRMTTGAGSAEIELASQCAEIGERTPGLMHHAIKGFAKAFEVIPRTLAENAGFDATDVLSKLYAAHANDSSSAISSIGVDVDDSEGTGIFDATTANIFDAVAIKSSAIKLATDAATTILTVDQIVMAKKAGGPAMPQSRPGNWDADD